MFAGAGAERGMGISASRGRAGPLNPRTPSRPDLKSGAVVLAWLPPRPAHRGRGIMPLGSACRATPARREDPELYYPPRSSDPHGSARRGRGPRDGGAGGAPAVDEAADALGRLDVLACVAGHPYREGEWSKAFPDLTPEEWRAPLEVDLLGTVFACQAAIPRMVRQIGRAHV